MKKWYYRLYHNHNFAKVRNDSFDSLPTEKILTFHVLIPIKQVVHKNKNSYYYNIFLDKGLYKDKFETRYFLMNFCIL